ncbi:MAG: hypothetical protein GF320_18350 [Armatimonadia bacterium]|nr:hypothetical protein [Armatimonadia bacterium]
MQPDTQVERGGAVFDASTGEASLALLDAQGVQSMPVRDVTVAGRDCASTDGASANYYLAFVTPEAFVPKGCDAIRFRVDYLDNGAGPVVLQHQSAYRCTPDGFNYRAGGVVVRRDSGEWRTAEWTVTDPLFSDLEAGLRFRLTGMEWERPDRSLYVSRVVAVPERLVVAASPSVLRTGGEGLLKLRWQGGPEGPLPDGTVVSLECDGATLPNTATFQASEAAVPMSAGADPGIVDLRLQIGDRTYQRSPCCVVAGTGAPRPQTVSRTPDELKAVARLIRGPVKGFQALVQEEDGESVLELQFQLEGRVMDGPQSLDVELPVSIPGHMLRLRMDAEASADLSRMFLYTRDGTGEVFQYTIWPDSVPAGRHELEVDALGLLYPSVRGDGDRLPDPPVSVGWLALTFDAGCQEAALRIYGLEMDVVA